MITEADRQIYEKYKDGHDGTMAEFLKWYERGGRTKRNRMTQSKKRIYSEALHIVEKMYQEKTGYEIADMIGVNKTDIYRLMNKQYKKVNIKKAKQIISYATD